MAIEQHNLFPAVNFPLKHFNGKSVNNEQFVFLNEDGETAFAFPGATEIYWKIFEEREGREIKSFTTATGISRLDNVITLNMSSAAMLFSQKGSYWHEMYYLTSGGYDFPLMYGQFVVI